jgi:hypothetical protein
MSYSIYYCHAVFFVVDYLAAAAPFFRQPAAPIDPDFQHGCSQSAFRSIFGGPGWLALLPGLLLLPGRPAASSGGWLLLGRAAAAGAAGAADGARRGGRPVLLKLPHAVSTALVR